jgi:ribosomal protein S18 acetylase RimI-like enzyme
MSYDEMRARYEIRLYFKNDCMVGLIVYDKKAYPSSLRIDITKKHTPYQEFATGSIAFLTVADEYHRQGIGTALLQEALNDMKKNGFQVVELYTQVNESAARALFEKHGFSLAMPIEDRAILCYYHLPLDLSVWPY